jgi:hypothetical protein
LIFIKILPNSIDVMNLIKPDKNHMQLGNFLLNAILSCNIIDFTFEYQAWIIIADVEKYCQKFSLSVLLLDLKIFKNSEFSLSEHWNFF